MTTMVVVISASTTSHFSMNTVVTRPCTINVSLGGYSSVACGGAQNSNQTPQVSYAMDSQNGDMIMTVEF